jgi:2-(1,2-epoxy-1,2-dihydrophenyl)acetyl-CoA isomerase
VTYEALRYEQADHVVIVTLDRPEVLNALDTQLLDELGQVSERVSGDPSVRAVVFTGAGRAFCSGGDLKQSNFAGSGRSAAAQDPNDHWAARLLAIRKPTIAAVNGVAAGGGLALALACDIRIASEAARFCAIFARIGMSVLDGTAWLLTRAVGHSKALEMLYTTDMVEAQEAARIGLVSRVVAPDELLGEATGLAGRIAASAPVALELSKRVVGASLAKSFLEHLPDQWAAQQDNLRRAEHDIAEGGRAFQEKRPPRFRGEAEDD